MATCLQIVFVLEWSREVVKISNPLVACNMHAPFVPIANTKLGGNLTFQS